MRIIGFPLIRDARGNLSFAERLPFEIKRVYWGYGIAAQAVRGGHAHRALRRILVAVHGSFKANVNGFSRTLDAADMGLLIEPMEWLELYDFSHDAAFMVLASAEYDESDYIRSRAEFDAFHMER